MAHVARRFLLVGLAAFLVACGGKPEPSPSPAPDANPQQEAAPQEASQPGAPALPAPAGQRLAGIVADDAAGLYAVSAAEEGTAEAARVRTNFWLADYRPTGRWAAPGVAFNVEVGALPPGVQASLLVGVWGDRTRAPAGDSVQAKPTEYALHPGVHSIVDPIGGPIHVRVLTRDQGREGEVRLRIAGARRLPVYRAGIGSLAGWRADVAGTDAPFVEVLTSRALLTLPTAEVRAVLAQESEAALARSIQALDDMAATYDAVAGLTATGGVHRPRANLLHFTAHWDARYYMYAFIYRTAYCADRCLGFVLGERFITDGWGPWHEAGHMYQGAWEWSDLTEVSVNLYSLEFQQRLGQPSRLTKDDADGLTGISHWDHALLVRPGLPRFDDLPVMERLVPLWQLRLAYGVEFWARLHQRYRDPTTRPADLAGDEARRQALIVEASRVTGQDLRGFFASWALRSSPETDRALEALSLPRADEELLLGLRPRL